MVGKVIWKKVNKIKVGILYVMCLIIVRFLKLTVNSLPVNKI